MAAAPFSSAQLDFFEQKIRPVLEKHCYECHSSAKKVKSGLRLDTRNGVLAGGESGPAVIPGKPAESILISALRHEDLQMPPERKLSDEIIADFARWIEMGLPDRRQDDQPMAVKLSPPDLETARQHWAFRAFHAHEPPAVNDTAWPLCDIDRFIAARLDRAGLRPAPDADRDTWLRRATFDLIGLPPTPDEQKVFAEDDSPEAFARVVDRLIASPRFGERWGRYWLDIARFGESTGKDRNIPYPQAWRYRNWVIDALNADKPYDRFIIEQLAGDLLPASTPAERNALLTATGFLAVGLKGLNEPNPEAYLLEVVDEQIDVTSRAMLGLTVACARCHDHKFDHVPTTDYYALAGIFRSTEVYDGMVNNSRHGSDPRRLRPLEQSGPESAALTAARESMLALEAKCADAQAEIARLRQANKSNLKPAQEIRKALEAEYNLATADYFVAAADAIVMTVIDRPAPMDLAVRIRGEVGQLGPQVARDVLTVCKHDTPISMPANSSGRLELAEWIASAQNPLTARVAVNRVWALLFGNGIVATADNFGVQGEPPTDPELLDTLAADFVADGWSVKRLIRRIVLSRVYRQSSAESDPEGSSIDGADALLWHFPRRRLEAEAIRDAVLAASGQLDLTRPAGSPVARLGALELAAGTALAADTPCRSVYLPVVRGKSPEMLRLFDQADPNLIVAHRDVTGTPPQALYLMNSEFLLDNAAAVARQLQTEPNEAARIERLYRLTMGRAPTAAEREKIQDFLSSTAGSDQQAGWTSVAHAVLMMPEFRFLD